MNMLPIEIVDSPDAAPNYARDTPDVRAAEITKVIVVKNGTVEGNTTVDFQITAMDGSKFVAMLTGAMVKQLAMFISGAEQSLEREPNA